jgi:hypothetical protein
MRDQMADYRRLLDASQDQSAAALRSIVPRGASAQWINAMLEIAITDYYSINKDLTNGPYLRCDVADRLLRLAQDENLMREANITDWYMRFARKAVIDRIEHIPPAMTIDLAVRRAMSSIGLSRADALSAAVVRRQKYQAVLDSLQPGEVLPRTLVGIENEHLLRIQYLLPNIFWFANFIHDVELANEVEEWFSIASRLSLGPEISRRLKRS